MLMGLFAPLLAMAQSAEGITRAELFRRADPWGIILTLICIAVVTIALTLLFFVFKYMGNFHVRMAERRAAWEKAAKKKPIIVGVVQTAIASTVNKKDDGLITNDQLTAIAIALYSYSKDIRDNEKSVNIINRASKANSPWCSKITIRQFPNKKYRYELQNKSQRRGI